MIEDEYSDRNLFYDNEDFDSSDLNNDTSTSIARKILFDCQFYDPAQLPNSKAGTSFYFNNIDGFTTNFPEFQNQILDQSEFDFYCFIKTNVNAEANMNFELDNYNSQFFSCIPGKSKGSRLAIYYKNNFNFKAD